MGRWLMRAGSCGWRVGGRGRFRPLRRLVGLVRHVSFDAPNTSCPAFGGADLTTLFCTSAPEGMDHMARAAHPDAGKTFAAHGVAKGQADHRIIP